MCRHRVLLYLGWKGGQEFDLWQFGYVLKSSRAVWLRCSHTAIMRLWCNGSLFACHAKSVSSILTRRSWVFIWFLIRAMEKSGVLACSGNRSALVQIQLARLDYRTVEESGYSLTCPGDGSTLVRIQPVRLVVLWIFEVSNMTLCGVG